MEPLGLSSYRLAKELHVSAPRVNDIVLGKRSITADTAMRLSAYFGNSAQFWLGLQNRARSLGCREKQIPGQGQATGAGGVTSSSAGSAGLVNRIASGPTAPPVMIMLIACSMFRSVSVTRSMGRICRKAEVGLMALGSSTAASSSPVVESVMVRVRNPMVFWPGDGKIDQHHALAGLFLGHHAVKQLAHGAVDLGDHGQPLQRGLKELECLAAHHLRGHAAHHIEHHQGEDNGQQGLQPRLAEPIPGEDGRQQLDHGQARLGQAAQKEAEDQVSNEQRSDGDDAGQDVALQAAQRTGKNWFSRVLLKKSIPEASAWAESPHGN